MKISLITSEESFINNYGAVLQGYALTRVVSRLGNSVEIIRYRGGGECGKRPQGFVSILRKQAKRVLRKLYYEYFRLPYKKEIDIQRRLFQQFQDRYMHFWNTERIDWCRLRECFPPADIYLCGSDQIWNPYTKDGRNDPGYFLDYVPHDKKRIAYAPSFGCDDIPPSARADLKYYIDQFASVSVREREGADIVRRYAGKTVPVLADPTFLLTPEQWCDIARIPPGTPDKYILCYRFMRNGTMTECIDDLSRCLSLPVITLPLSTLSLRDRYIKQFEAGPEDFIGLIRGAALVCTDSFHATAFSMLMNTPFYTFLDLDAGNYGTNMNSRIRNAIGLAGLESRVIRTKGEIDLSAVFDVDFSECNKSLDAFRAVSLEWLTGALAEVPV